MQGALCPHLSGTDLAPHLISKYRQLQIYAKSALATAAKPHKTGFQKQRQNQSVPGMWRFQSFVACSSKVDNRSEEALRGQNWSGFIGSAGHKWGFMFPLHYASQGPCWLQVKYDRSADAQTPGLLLTPPSFGLSAFPSQKMDEFNAEKVKSRFPYIL